MEYIYKTGLGQDSHRFSFDAKRACILGGVHFPLHNGFEADSDGDVILHSICNAITSISGVPILGGVAQKMCKEGIFDSKEYLKEALKTIASYEIVHLAISIEAKTPHLEKKIPEIKSSLGGLLQVSLNQIGITATSGDELTDFGKGLGVQCFCILTVRCH